MNTKTITRVITLSFLTATMIHATNGDNLIGIGAKARGMGGTGIAVSHGAESGLFNPALITSVKTTEISFGGTIFMPDIETSFSGGIPPQTHISDADISMIPEVSIAHKINDNWHVGIGMWGTAGMGTDYSKAGNVGAAFATGQFANFNMVTNLQLLQFGIPIAYNSGGFSIAVTPIMQYGNLDINFVMPTGQPAPADQTTIGSGLSQDFGFGFNLGIAYDLSANGIDGLTVGAIYKSAIEMEYDGQLTTATRPFRLSLPDGDILEQPAEIGFGISYSMGQHLLAFDYKTVKWSDAKGYSDFGWEDQDVYAFGYEYSQDNWTLRAGYNYASSAVVEVRDPRLNFFNLLGFPATSEEHYTIGGTYTVSKNFSVDLAYVYSPETSNTFSAVGLGLPITSLSNTHLEDSISFQLNYTF